MKTLQIIVADFITQLPRIMYENEKKGSLCPNLKEAINYYHKMCEMIKCHIAHRLQGIPCSPFHSVYLNTRQIAFCEPSAKKTTEQKHELLLQLFDDRKNILKRADDRRRSKLKKKYQNSCSTTIDTLFSQVTDKTFLSGISLVEQGSMRIIDEDAKLVQFVGSSLGDFLSQNLDQVCELEKTIKDIISQSKVKDNKIIMSAFNWFNQLKLEIDELTLRYETRSFYQAKEVTEKHKKVGIQVYKYARLQMFSIDKLKYKFIEKGKDFQFKTVKKLLNFLSNIVDCAKQIINQKQGIETDQLHQKSRPS